MSVFNIFKHIPGLTLRTKNAMANAAMLQQLPFISGQWFFVDARYGSDYADGSTPDHALKTLKAAYDLCTTGDGDGICLISRTISGITYAFDVTASIAWTKYGITIYGLCAPTFYNQRCKIQNLSTSVTLTELINFTTYNTTVYNCSFNNIPTTAGAQMAAVKLTSNYRSAFINCDFKGQAGTASAYISG
jgi:hypothetical protein